MIKGGISAAEVLSIEVLNIDGKNESFCPSGYLSGEGGEKESQDP